MSRAVSSLALLDRVRGADPAAIARLISRAEAGSPEARPVLARVYQLAGRAHVVGITGVPGSGKSTLVGKLAQKLRVRNLKVGVVAIDPSSPYSGGAILGDRIRMSELAGDSGTYIRSMATRGAIGGLARAALDVVDILDVAGFETIIVETVGVGQDEVEIARASHTTIVVSAPGLGDEIQAIKAGVLEIADIHVVSKYDRSNANRTVIDLKQMLMLGTIGAAPREWAPPVIGTSAVSGEGIDELAEAIQRHRRVAFESRPGRERSLAIAAFRLRKTAENLLLEHNPALLSALRDEIADWEAKELAAFLKKQAERRSQFFTGGGIPLKRLYTAADIADMPLEDLGPPGRYPYTRGPYPTMYRSRYWTMRQIAGFGTGEDTNKRFKYLIAQGQTGLSTDFDMPTLMGYDSDHPVCEGEVGREGVAVDTLADMEALFEGIDLENISVSMTINPTAWILLAMYVALAQKRGYDLNRLSGTIQADILKEYMAQKEYIYPIAPSVRIVRDCITYCAKHMKRYNPINISGYHISEAGSSPLHEAAFTLANGIVYVQEVLKTGMDVDEFAPRLAFYFVSQTAAATLTKPQYQVNIVRTAMQALSAVLGGCQSLHTNGYDEAFAIPTEDAMRMALRTQQVIAEETNVASVIDPLGGSYYVESLTNEFEKRIFALLDEVEERSGTLKLIEEGWFQKHIADFAYETAIAKQTGDKAVIGVNKLVLPEEVHDIELHPYDPSTAERQIARTRRVRRERDERKVQRLLDELLEVARDESRNIMPVTIELVREGATMGDIVEKLRTLWGTYRENPVF